MLCESWLLHPAFVKQLLVEVPFMLGIEGVDAAPPLFQSKIAELFIADVPVAVFIDDGEDLSCLLMGELESQ